MNQRHHRTADGSDVGPDSRVGGGQLSVETLSSLLHNPYRRTRAASGALIFAVEPKTDLLRDD